MKIRFLTIIFTLFWLAVPVLSPASTSYPVAFNDSAGNRILIQSEPRKVVSLVPAVTEMIIALGAADHLSGITAGRNLPAEAAGIPLVGGHFFIDHEHLEAIQPAVIFAPANQESGDRALPPDALVVRLQPDSIEQGFAHLRLLGKIFGRQQEAETIITREKAKLALVRKKTAKLAGPEKRIIRLWGEGKLMVPADSSLHQDFIRAAGGTPPSFGISGKETPVTLQQWQKFNPQVIYGCGPDKELLEVINQPGWNRVEAVEKKKTFFLPCGLANRAATHSGDFATLLAARSYTDEFSDPDNYVLPEKVVASREVPLDLDWVKKAEIVESDIYDFRNKTLLLHLADSMTVVSTLAGQLSGIETVANHYFPPPSWGVGHEKGLAGLREHTRKVLGLEKGSTAMLFTGADMDNLAVVNKRFKDLSVFALVTAGVSSNAVRMAEDVGRFYKPGTINMLICTNRHLSPRAMTRAIISATEAKSAALADLDIRSSYTPRRNQATGTGTDNIIVLQGRGAPADASGGHTRLGEYIARAVYDGVQEAVRRQNSLVQARNIFQRLRERNISVGAIAGSIGPRHDTKKTQKDLEELLLEDEAAGFLQTSLAISDTYERGLPVDLGTFDLWCRTMADRVAGRHIELATQDGLSDLPIIIRKSFNALICGLQARGEDQ